MTGWVYAASNNSTAETVAELVVAARYGKSAAWTALHDRFTPALRSAARQYRLSTEDVEDVVQETWLKCVEHIEDIRDPAALPGWLLMTCRRTSLQTLSRQTRNQPFDPDHLAVTAEACGIRASGVDPAATVEEAEVVGAVHRSVSALPHRQQRLVQRLLQLEGSPNAYRTIAAQLSMPIGSVGPTRLRALAQLRQDPALQAL